MELQSASSILSASERGSNMHALNPRTRESPDSLLSQDQAPAVGALHPANLLSIKAGVCVCVCVLLHTADSTKTGRQKKESVNEKCKPLTPAFSPSI